MAKGLCCEAQAAGDLGKPLVIDVVRKDGTHTERCGVCEVVRSCKDQTKKVFAFRFLPAGVCGIGAKKCLPTAAGIAQYDAAARQMAAGTERTEYIPIETGTNGRVTGFRGMPIPGAHPTPYRLPLA